MFYALKIHNDAKVSDLKKMVEEKSGVKLSDMELHTTNRMLNEDDKTLEECGIKDNDMLLLELKESANP